MQPSQYDIQREVEALRDLRRRSTSQGGPGVLLLDPDLPNAATPPSPTTAYWSPAASSPSSPEVGSSSSSSNEGDVSTPDGGPNSAPDDPFHLFWVPANLHPEIAPAEFKAFLKEHARAPSADSTTTLSRSGSASSISSLSRRKSMLSRPYRPSDKDDSEDESVVPLRRNRSIYLNPVPQLTISDLQKLEELAEQASEGDASELRTILKRSLSLNMSPSEVEKMDRIPEMGDEADSPIIVPPPGQILRRSARTKIRKSGLPGDGGGHRFGSSTRRGRGAAAGTATERRVSDTPPVEQRDPPEPPRRRTFSNEPAVYRPESFSDETAIFEAYARDDDEDEDEEYDQQMPSVRTSPPPAVETPAPPPIEEPPPQPSPVIEYQPQPQRLGVPPPAEPRSIQRTPSPEAPSYTPLPQPDFNQSPPPLPSGSGLMTPPVQSRKEPDKKGLFGMWGSGSKSGKKGHKDKDREIRDRNEKDSGFFGSLFGNKKKQEDGGQTLGHTASGRETAAALLGGSKSSRSYVPSTSPSLMGPNGTYARYPIHVERAIYRLSHIKLANPRRPLYEQVLISNLMFWYLGVINKTQNPTATTGPGQAAGQPASTAVEKDQKESEEEQPQLDKNQERLEKEKAEKDRLERERIAMEQKKETRRGPLTKPPMAGSPPRRAAEMPVKGPQYDLQHRVMEQEYGGYTGQSSGTPVPTARSPSGPGQPRMQQASGSYGQFSGQPQVQSQQPQQQPNYYYPSGASDQPQNQHRSLQLPPGAMPPVDNQLAWLASASSPSSPRPSSSPPTQPSSSPPTPGYPDPRRSRSPPPANSQPSFPNRYTPPQEKGRVPSRSMSATVPPPPPTNGKLRKGGSANAAMPLTNGRPRTSDGSQGEEEDVPLAIWQQRRR